MSIDIQKATTAVDMVGLASLINEVYLKSEGDLFIEGYQRINQAELLEMIERIHLASSGTKLVGCICLSEVEEGVTSFSMLAVDPTLKGQGLGRDLVDYAERYALRKGHGHMQLELLTPREGSHVDKVFLDAWYRRRGYVIIQEEPFENHHPNLVPLLRVPCNYTVYRKPLT